MILFCEYAVQTEFLEEYRTWAASHPSLWEGTELLENDAQPGVFVEIRRCAGDDDAMQKQKERLDGRSEWKEIEPWVKGGREGVRVWIFRPVITAG